MLGLVALCLDGQSAGKPSLVEVLRRHSKNYGAVQRIGRLSRHLEEQPKTAKPCSVQPVQRPYHHTKLSQRLSDEAVVQILAAYQAGETTREVGARFGLAHASVNKLLKQHGVAARRRSPGEAERVRAVALYAAGRSTRQIGAELGLGASTVQRVLRSEGVELRPRFGTCQ